MAAAFAFLGMLLLSLVVAVLAALQLGDFFLASDEFTLVLGLVAGFGVASMALLAATHLMSGRTRILNAVALVLALAALALTLAPGLVPWLTSHSTNPYSIGTEQTAIRIALAIPALIAVLVQWGLVRRRAQRIAGEDDLTRWPWVVTAVAGFLILNPIGLAFAATALNPKGGDMMWEFFATITGAVAAALVVMAAIECYIRGRMLRRRLGPPPPLSA